MRNFCTHCGADLRKQSKDAYVGDVWVEIGPYDEGRGRYAIEGDIPVSHCTECGELTASVSPLCDADEFIHVGDSVE